MKRRTTRTNRIHLLRNRYTVKASSSLIVLILAVTITAMAQQQALVPEAALVVKTITGQSLKMGQQTSPSCHLST